MTVLQVAQMDADIEQAEVGSSADEEGQKQAATEHLEATVISYVLVSSKIWAEACAVPLLA